MPTTDMNGKEHSSYAAALAASRKILRANATSEAVRQAATRDSYQFDSPSPEQFALAQEHAKNRVFAYRQNAARLARLNDTVKRLSRYDPNHDLWRALIERDSLEAHQGKERVWVNASFRAREHSRRPPRSQVVFDPALRAELADTSPRKRPPETYLGGY